MADSDHPAPLTFALNRIPNVLLVLLAVALLLQGPVGAFEALWGYTRDLVLTIFGGEELLLQVLCQTVPLTLAVGAILFSFRARWISLSNPASLFAASALILAGTWIGGELRSTVSSETVLENNDVVVSPTKADTRTMTALGKTQTLLSDQSLTDSLDQAEDPDADSVSDTISIAEAWSILSDFKTVATDGNHHRWDQPVPRIDLVPESETLWGLVGKAMNQLLGYFVIYRPRLFLASILLGSYIGWSWQPYFESIRSWIRERTRRKVFTRH